MSYELENKVCMVTGATSGIGEVAAEAFAEMGAELFLVCRNQAKGEQTKSNIIQRTGNESVTLLVGDLSSLDEVRQIAHSFLDYEKPLHVLLNNAGIVNLKREVTEDGHEAMFAVNHLAHFLLTNLLLDRIRESAPARIVNVASEAHIMVKGINFEDLSHAEGFSAMKVYGHSKLANLLFNRELSKQIKGTGVTANAVHPGTVATGLGLQNGRLGKLINLLMKVFLQSPRKGARTSIYTSVSPDLEGVSGRYYAACREKQPKPWALDDAAAQRLWEDSLRLTKLASSLAAQP